MARVTRPGYPLLAPGGQPTLFFLSVLLLESYSSPLPAHKASGLCCAIVGRQMLHNCHRTKFTPFKLVDVDYGQQFRDVQSISSATGPIPDRATSRQSQPMAAVPFGGSKKAPDEIRGFSMELVSGSVARP